MKETSIAVAFIALGHTENAAISEKRYERHCQARLVALKLRSVETEGMFIEPVEEIALGKLSVRGVTPVSAVVSDAKVPPHDEPEKLEIDFDPVQSFGIVSTREKTLVLADLGDEEVLLPADLELIGVVPAPAGTFSVNVYDGETNDEFRLGYHIN